MMDNDLTVEFDEGLSEEEWLELKANVHFFNDHNDDNLIAIYKANDQELNLYDRHSKQLKAVVNDNVIFGQSEKLTLTRFTMQALFKVMDSLS